MRACVCDRAHTTGRAYTLKFLPLLLRHLSSDSVDTPSCRAAVRKDGDEGTHRCMFTSDGPGNRVCLWMCTYRCVCDRKRGCTVCERETPLLSAID